MLLGRPGIDPPTPTKITNSTRLKIPVLYKIINLWEKDVKTDYVKTKPQTTQSYLDKTGKQSPWRDLKAQNGEYDCSLMSTAEILFT